MVAVSRFPLVVLVPPDGLRKADLSELFALGVSYAFHRFVSIRAGI